jgi:hypothetical protein
MSRPAGQLLTPGKLRELWDPISLKPERTYRASLCTVEFWIKRSKADWYVAHRPTAVELPACGLQPVAAAEEPGNAEWARWVAGDDAPRIHLVPTLPDRSVVLRPRYPLHVPRGRSVLFFVNIPLWIRVLVGASPGTTLTEIPTIALSNSWFGAPTSGELCYALKTKALRDLEEVSNHPYVVTCPVSVENQAPSDLKFERLCVRVEHLHVYRGQRRLWTNQVEVVFKGEELVSQINIRRYAPVFEQASERLCPAREPVDHSLLKKSFSFLRSITGF